MRQTVFPVPLQSAGVFAPLLDFWHRQSQARILEICIRTNCRHSRKVSISSRLRWLPPGFESFERRTGPFCAVWPFRLLICRGPCLRFS